MAESPTHRFGQIIGEVLEESLREPLASVASAHNLYLDHRHPRAARKGQAKVGWVDSRGNRHDLDFVLEAGGSEENVGLPRAFIEIAYRRYTKHSRNKAQEIQGAIGPLFETFAKEHPFIGVVLAGVFTEKSLAQLRSHGFGVLYLPFDSLVKAFAVVGIDAHFDEDSSDREVRRKVRAFEALPSKKRRRIAETLRDLHREDFAGFVGQIERCLTRRIDRILILSLHGSSVELRDVAAAIAFVEGFNEGRSVGRFVRHEIQVRYSNGDEVRGGFGSKADAVAFLRSVR